MLVLKLFERFWQTAAVKDRRHGKLKHMVLLHLKKDQNQRLAQVFVSLSFSVLIFALSVPFSIYKILVVK